MLLDANLLLSSVDTSSPFHDVAATWLEDVLNGDEAVAIPWQTIGAFVRIGTHPRVSERPMTSATAWGIVEDWLAAPVTWVPPATERTARVYARRNDEISITGNLVTDAQSAAVAIEHGLELLSVDAELRPPSGPPLAQPVGMIDEV